MSLDPQKTYASLRANGDIREVLSDSFWSMPEDQAQAIGREWLVSEYLFEADWPTWEMHPDADELVYLISGSIELVLDEPAGERTIPMVGSGALVVPRGVWHTAKVRTPSRMLHVTLGAGTLTRPA